MTNIELEKKKNMGSQTETSRIFYYFMSQIYQAESTKILLPSSREIAKNFGVSRALVQRVINSLVRSGSLITQHGSGTYTNPANSDRRDGFDERPPLVGLISGAGSPLFFNNTSWKIISDTGSALTMKRNMVRHINFLNLDNAAFINVIKNLNLNGLVGLYTGSNLKPLFTQLMNDNFPVVSFGYAQEGINSVVPDCVQNGYELGLRFLSEGRKKLFFGVSVTRDEEYLNGFRRAYATKGVPFDESLVFDNELSFLKELKQKIEQGCKPDAFFIQHFDPKKIIALLHSYDIDICKQCRLFLFDEAVIPESNFCGFVRNVNFAQGAEVVEKMMKRMIHNKDFSIELIKIPVTYREIN